MQLKFTEYSRYAVCVCASVAHAKNGFQARARIHCSIDTALSSVKENYMHFLHLSKYSRRVGRQADSGALRWLYILIRIQPLDKALVRISINDNGNIMIAIKSLRTVEQIARTL